MTLSLPISIDHLTSRREALGMSFAALANRSGVSEPTVKRMLGGHLGAASFANVAAVAQALGATLGFEEIDPDELCRQQARRKAERVARLVQGTSALESQAVDAQSYNRLVEKSYHELLAGSRRRLWSQ
jgi:transcriptional regulator with XRE-family HTH domain